VFAVQELLCLNVDFRRMAFMCCERTCSQFKTRMQFYTKMQFKTKMCTRSSYFAFWDRDGIDISTHFIFHDTVFRFGTFSLKNISEVLMAINLA